MFTDLNGSKWILILYKVCINQYLHHYFNKHVCLSIRPSVCPSVRSLKFFFAKSTNVTNRCCHICFSDDKNVFGIITWPPGGSRGGGPKRARGGHTKSRSNEKMLLINIVPYASVMTKMCWASWARGGSHQKSVKWKNVINKLCCLCFNDDENAFGVTPDPLGGHSRGPRWPLGLH